MKEDWLQIVTEIRVCLIYADIIFFCQQFINCGRFMEETSKGDMHKTCGSPNIVVILTKFYSGFFNPIVDWFWAARRLDLSPLCLGFQPNCAVQFPQKLVEKGTNFIYFHGKSLCFVGQFEYLNKILIRHALVFFFYLNRKKIRFFF